MNLEVDGRTIAFDDSGGAGVPLVLLHGFACDRSIWDRVTSLLDGPRVIRIDFRGSGGSEPGDGPALMEALAGDVAGLLDALGVDRAAIAGHSMGGYVAFAYFRMYAERVCALALINSSARSDTADASAGRDALILRLEHDGTMDAVASTAPTLVAPRTTERDPAIVRDLAAMLQRQSVRGAIAQLRGMQVRVPSDDVLADIRVPTLVLAGAFDALVSPDAAREMADGIAGATSIVIADAGHSLPLESADRTAKALAELAGTAA